MEFGGVRFESLSRTITSVSNHLLSGDFYLLHDPITLLDVVGVNNLSDEAFPDERFHAT